VPADAYFVDRVVSAIRSRGGRAIERPAGIAPNPFAFAFTLDAKTYRALIHVRRITPQEGVGTRHGRPKGEWHAQMIFDDSRRGAGVRNRLQTHRGYVTVLLGYVVRKGRMVISAWDPGRKANYAYSRSLQVKQVTLEEARRTGVAQQSVHGREVIAAFRAEFLPEYLASVPTLHSDAVLAASESLRGPLTLPEDVHAPRERRSARLTRAVRDIRFKAYITDKYSECAICGISASPVLEAAHLVPVTDARSSDHPSNGLRLCRNCHRLFDTGYLLIRPDYRLEVSDHFAAHAPDDADAYRQSKVRLRLPRIPRECLPDPEKLAYVYERRRLGAADAW
jgi:hypothetical protein